VAKLPAVVLEAELLEQDDLVPEKAVPTVPIGVPTPAEVEQLPDPVVLMESSGPLPLEEKELQLLPFET
jgi:hypothetical protein